MSVCHLIFERRASWRLAWAVAAVALAATLADTSFADGPATEPVAVPIRFLDPDEITVLVMKRVQDVDVPSYNLMGVHWRYRGSDPALGGRRWVYLTGRAKPPVLAHELCHYFGVPHDPEGGNLMTPGPSDPVWKTDHAPKPYRPILTPAQARRLAAGIRRSLAPSTAR